MIEKESYKEYAERLESYWERKKKRKEAKRKLLDRQEIQAKKKKEKNSSKKKNMGDFSEEEQNTIYDECMKESMTIEEIGKTSY